MTDTDLTDQVIDCVTEVHRQTGPGLSRETYESCLALELTANGVPFERGRVLTAVYKGRLLDFTCRTDLIVAESLLLQVEAADRIEPEHEQKLRTCLWMGQLPVGLLLNFNVVDIDEGISRMTGHVEEEASSAAVQDVFDDPDLGLADP